MLFSVFFICKTILAQATFGTQLASPGRENEKMPEKSEVQGIIGGGGVPSDPVFAMGWNETVFDKSEAAFARRRTRTA